MNFPMSFRFGGLVSAILSVLSLCYPRAQEVGGAFRQTARPVLIRNEHNSLLQLRIECPQPDVMLRSIELVLDGVEAALERHAQAMRHDLEVVGVGRVVVDREALEVVDLLRLALFLRHHLLHQRHELLLRAAVLRPQLLREGRLRRRVPEHRRRDLVRRQLPHLLLQVVVVAVFALLKIHSLYWINRLKKFYLVKKYQILK